MLCGDRATGRPAAYDSRTAAIRVRHAYDGAGAPRMIFSSIYFGAVFNFAQVNVRSAARQDHVEYSLEISGNNRFGLLPHNVYALLRLAQEQCVERNDTAATSGAQQARHFTVQLIGRQPFAGINIGHVTAPPANANDDSGNANDAPTTPTASDATERSPGSHKERQQDEANFTYQLNRCATAGRTLGDLPSELHFEAASAQFHW